MQEIRALRMLALSIALLLFIGAISATPDVQKALNDVPGIELAVVFMDDDNTVDVIIWPSKGHNNTENFAYSIGSISAALGAYTSLIGSNEDTGQMDLSLIFDNMTVISNMYCQPDWIIGFNDTETAKLTLKVLGTADTRHESWPSQ